MIYQAFTISNPFDKTGFKNLFSRSGRFTENKSWEFEVSKGNILLHLCLQISTRRSHAGIVFSIGLLGFETTFQIYDNRHWDYEKNEWMKYDNSNR